MSIFSAESINRSEVSADQIREVLERVAALDPSERGFEAHTIIAVHVVGELGLEEERRRAVTTALNFRLMALAKVIDEHGAPGWSKQGKAGATLIHEEVLARAAVQPLKEIDNELQFDPVEFVSGLLLNTELGGTA